MNSEEEAVPLDEKHIQRQTIALCLLAAAVAWGLITGYLRTQGTGDGPGLLTSLVPGAVLIAAAALTWDNPRPARNTERRSAQTIDERQPQ